MPSRLRRNETDAGETDAAIPSEGIRAQARLPLSRRAALPLRTPPPQRLLAGRVLRGTGSSPAASTAAGPRRNILRRRESVAAWSRTVASSRSCARTPLQLVVSVTGHVAIGAVPPSRTRRFKPVLAVGDFACHRPSITVAVAMAMTVSVERSVAVIVVPIAETEPDDRRPEVPESSSGKARARRRSRTPA